MVSCHKMLSVALQFCPPSLCGLVLLIPPPAVPSLLPPLLVMVLLQARLGAAPGGAGVMMVPPMTVMLAVTPVLAVVPSVLLGDDPILPQRGTRGLRVAVSTPHVNGGTNRTVVTEVDGADDRLHTAFCTPPSRSRRCPFRARAEFPPLRGRRAGRRRGGARERVAFGYRRKIVLSFTAICDWRIWRCGVADGVW